MRQTLRQNLRLAIFIVGCALSVGSAVMWVRSYYVAEAYQSQFGTTPRGDANGLRIASNAGLAAIAFERLDASSWRSKPLGYMRRDAATRAEVDAELLENARRGWYRFGFGYTSYSGSFEREIELIVPHWAICSGCALLPLCMLMARWRGRLRGFPVEAGRSPADHS